MRAKYKMAKIPHIWEILCSLLQGSSIDTSRNALLTHPSLPYYSMCSAFGVILLFGTLVFMNPLIFPARGGADTPLIHINPIKWGLVPGRRRLFKKPDQRSGTRE